MMIIFRTIARCTSGHSPTRACTHPLTNRNSTPFFKKRNWKFAAILQKKIFQQYNGQQANYNISPPKARMPLRFGHSLDRRSNKRTSEFQGRTLNISGDVMLQRKIESSKENFQTFSTMANRQTTISRLQKLGCP